MPVNTPHLPTGAGAAPKQAGSETLVTDNGKSMAKILLAFGGEGVMKAERRDWGTGWGWSRVDKFTY